MAINVFIVEDEIIYLADLTILLEEANYNLIGSTDNADDAFDKIKELRPDVVLVDIALPGFNNGITLSERINKELGIPHIFTTSFGQDEIMEQAIATNPIGYLKKPIDFVNLKAAIEIAINGKKEIKEENTETTPNNKQQLIFTKIGDRLVKIPIQEIKYIKADGDNYTSIFLGNKELSCQTTLKHLLGQLPSHFMQIHRSVVINLNFLTEINEQIQVAIIEENELPIGRKYKKSLRAAFTRI